MNWLWFEQVKESSKIEKCTVRCQIKDDNNASINAIAINGCRGTSRMMGSGVRRVHAHIQE